MLEWIIQISIISLILIILIHYLFTFFKTNLTIPKVKDLVNKPQKQYEVLFNTMNEKNSKNKNDTTIDKKIDNIDSENMKNELKNYLKELSGNKTSSSNNNNNNNNGLLTGESVMSGSFSSNNYSTF